MFYSLQKSSRILNLPIVKIYHAKAKHLILSFYTMHWKTQRKCNMHLTKLRLYMTGNVLGIFLVPFSGYSSSFYLGNKLKYFLMFKNNYWNFLYLHQFQQKVLQTSQHKEFERQTTNYASQFPKLSIINQILKR